MPWPKNPGEIDHLGPLFLNIEGSPNPKGTLVINQTTKARSSGLGGFFAGATWNSTQVEWKKGEMCTP